MTGIVSTPLWSEWLALRDRLAADVVHTGRSSDGGLEQTSEQPVLIAGVAGALGNELRPGDLVVADEIRGEAEPIPSHASSFLVGALRRAGLRVHHGPIVTTRRIVDAPDARRALGATGALVADTESALVAAAAPLGQAAVIRAWPARVPRSRSRVRRPNRTTSDLPGRSRDCRSRRPRRR